jgi:preprotein translocase subunit SecA
MANILKRIFGSRNDRVVRKMRTQVSSADRYEEDLSRLSAQELKDKTAGFRKRLESGATLDDLLPESFAVVREAARRTLGMRHFDVQLVGGAVLHDGKIAEMRTGEGKTLVATAAAYLNALPGHGVHVITVNDYLARRDADWMGRVYSALGLSVGIINASGGRGVDGSSYLYDQDYDGLDGGYLCLRPVSRREAYAADITYGTNSEFGFDYLRDNMVFSMDHKVQRGHYFAIIDEVDSILIDEARTPLIISGPAEDSTALYLAINSLVPKLRRQNSDEAPGDFVVDEKNRQAHLTEDGHEKVELLLTEAGLLPQGASLYDAAHIVLMHHLLAGLRAHTLFQRDVDYIVRDGQVIIIDEFTGRTMEGRRWSDGLHQAIEAKEAVAIQSENHTLASITYQNYFRIYRKLSGMTGTADTEAPEFLQIYGLEVIVIPTHRPMVRDDRPDLVYLTLKEKYEAVIEDVRSCVEKGQPVLVGTASIETSELISNQLTVAGISHQVLNAKHHEREAQIIAQAGRPGAVTIATNMAGRGTDILLGGNVEAEIKSLGTSASDAEIAHMREEWRLRHQSVLAAGGLHIVGTERHESRRVDNQLRGRAGRQGDPGSSRFYLSLEDNLMRIFASDRVSAIMKKLGMRYGESIEHMWVTKAIENAQRKVEAHNFDIRKNLLEYDNVANDQRKEVYLLRDELMSAADIAERIRVIRHEMIQTIFHQHVPPGSLEEQWDLQGLESAMIGEFAIEAPARQWLQDDPELYEEPLLARLQALVDESYAEKEREYGDDVMRFVERDVMLRVLDTHWKEHLAAMDYLRQSIYLRGYAQRDPRQEYKRESFEMFGAMLFRIKHEVTRILSRLRLQQEPDEVAAASVQSTPGNFASNSQLKPAPTAWNRVTKKGQSRVSRNDPCPCGSGKKYKYCHGALN